MSETILNPIDLFQDKLWLDTGEAAKMTGLTSQTIRKMVDRKEIPAQIYGKTRRILRSDVIAFIKSKSNCR
ncbi:MAG: helix-turn-helix domain-containing protein [Chitinispirillales bacterium]|jgi:excisionase family DNA binding protein|nr:helix-turn-helix domain-containing protein [Chitinispirillales bacterium]